MKKFIIILVLIASLFATGCADKKVINGKVYKPYGLVTKKEIKDPNIEYEIVYGNVVWGIILSESIVAPLYFVSFSLWEPVGLKNVNDYNVKY
jgi:hypothetical protein